MVFGSNGAGAHAGGAARFALDNFGAVWGQSEGLQGRSYAIDTMSGLDVMSEQIGRFLSFAETHPELMFLVTEIGCGIAGYTPADVAPLFTRRPVNVQLPDAFTGVAA